MIIKRRNKLFSDPDTYKDFKKLGNSIKVKAKKAIEKIKEGQEKRRIPRVGYGIDPVDGFHIHQQHMMDHNIAHSVGTGLI